MKFVIKEATTIDEAVSNGLEELGVTKDNAEIEVLENPSSGFLGLFGKSPAKVKVSHKFDEIENMKEIVTKFFEIIDVQCDITITKSGKNILNVSISNENLGYLIGKHGMTLKALEQIFSLAINKKSPYRLSLVLDIGNYIEKRKESLQNHALHIADKVKRSKRKYTFEAMSSYERKIIHTVLQEIAELKTYSIGTSPNRKVVVEYKSN